MRTLKSNKQIFIVTIDEKYWESRYLAWNTYSPDQKLENRNREYDEIDKLLTSGKESITIFCPMHNGKALVSVKKLSGKKGAKIIYSTKRPATGSGK